jgi:hypothetical protein
MVEPIFDNLAKGVSHVTPSSMVNAPTDLVLVELFPITAPRGGCISMAVPPGRDAVKRRHGLELGNYMIIPLLHNS